MSQVLTNTEDILAASSEETYQALRRNLKRRKGFGLLFVRCSPAEGERLIARIQEDITDKKIESLILEQAIDNLYEIVEQLQNQKEIDVLFVTGIEKSFVADIKPGIGGQGDYYKEDTVPRLLSHLNLQRERFRDELNICFVFLVPRFALKYFVRRAPDFFDWRSGVFEFPTDKVQVEQELFRIVLEGDYQKYLNLGCHEEEIASYDQPLKFKPDNNQAWYNKACCYALQGNVNLAIENLRQAINLNPDKYREMAKTDSDFDSIREDEQFQALIP